jgi:GH15 family glucan-1,4-alpha-glucosidase
VGAPLEDDTRIAVAGPDASRFRTPSGPRREHEHRREFTVEPGERVPFVLTWFRRTRAAARDRPRAALDDTCAFWTSGSASCRTTAATRRRLRSLTVLKAMTYARPAGSSPRRRPRCRSRSAASATGTTATAGSATRRFALARCRNGFVEEAGAWRSWLLRAVAGDPDDLQIMYGPAGERRLTELQLDWLDGYEGSQPVRIGNGASEQFQLDVYGEVLDLLYQARRRGLMADESAWALVRHCSRTSRRAGASLTRASGGARAAAPLHPLEGDGLGGVRPRAAADRGARSHGPEDDWRRSATRSGPRLLEQGFDEELGSFVQSYGSKERRREPADDPARRLPAADDPRVRGTLEAIARELLVDGFVQRYRHDDAPSVDGLPPGRALLPLLVLVRRQPDPARRARRGTRAVRAAARAPQRLGLLSEEYDPQLGGSSATSRRRSRTSGSSTRRCCSTRPSANGKQKPRRRLES